MPDLETQTALAAVWSQVSAAAEVAARSYRVGQHADDVCQTTALRCMEYAATAGGMPSAATIGAIAKRAANALSRSMAREPVGIGSDITDQQKSADDGTRSRAAVAGRRARIGVRQRHDVFAVAESSRVAMRPADDVSAITHRAAALGAALDAEWSPTRPAERAAWDAMLASASAAEPVASGPLMADAEPADVNPATRGPLVALRPAPLVWHASTPTAPVSRSERAAARAAARVARSDAEYAASMARHTGRAGASAIAAAMASAATRQHRAAVDGLHRVRPVITAERSAEPIAIGAAERPADVLLSAYRPEVLTTRKSPEGSGPVVVTRGVAVPCGPLAPMLAAYRDGEPRPVKSPATGRDVVGAPREVSPAGVLSDAGRGTRKVRVSEVLPDQRAAQAALGRAAKSWAADVRAGVLAAEVNRAAALRAAAYWRRVSEWRARIGPRTYHWVRTAAPRTYNGPPVGASRVASAEAAADAGAAESERYSEWCALPTRRPDWSRQHAAAARRADVVARWHASRAAAAERSRLRQHADRSPNARLALAAADGPAAYFAAWRQEYRTGRAIVAALALPMA